MNPSRLFILRPVATTLLMVALFGAGVIAYRELPVSALPQVDYPTIQVVTFYPGGSAEVMASSVTAPLERQFGQMPGLQQMSSQSSLGSSVIVLTFVLSLSLDVAEQEVQAAINAAATYLPPDLPVPPIYSKVNPADAPVLTLALTSPSLALSRVEDLADTRFAQRISQLPGVGLVTLSGGQRPAVRIHANPTALSARGLTLEDVRTAVAAASVNLAKGGFDGPRLSYTINANDQLTASKDYRQIVLAYRNGAPVALGDVAEVDDGVENVALAAWMNQTPAVIVNIQRQPGANVIDVVGRVKTLLPQLVSTLPPSVAVTILTDRTVTIRAAIRDVELELGVSVALVVLVIFLFLRSPAATVIPSVAVPLSLVGSFGLMYLAGFSLNNLTLMALTIATGFVVDDAIVMIENVARYIERGDAPREAALRGAAQIAFTILSLTVSLIAVLIPLLFMADVVGRLFREFAVTLGVTILLSAFVSLTLTPMLCARLLRRTPEAQQGWFYRTSQRVFDRVIASYGRSLRIVLRHQRAMLAVAAAALVATVLLYVYVPKGFFPTRDTGLLLGVTQASDSISFAAMSRVQQQVAAAVLADPAVASLSSFVGVDGTNPTVSAGRLLVNLKPLDVRKEDAQVVARRLEARAEQVPGIVLYLQSAGDLTVETQQGRAPYRFTLQSHDARELAMWSTKVVAALRALPDLRAVGDDAQDAGLTAQLDIDRPTAARLGVTAQLIIDTLYDAYGQRQIATVFTQSNQYRVVLDVAPDFARKPERLRDLYLRAAPASTAAPLTAAAPLATPLPTLIPAAATLSTAPGSANPAVPLDAVTRLHLTTGPLVIHRMGQFPATAVSFDLAARVSLGQAVHAVNRAVAQLDLPPSVQHGFAGTARAFVASLKNEPLLILAALIAVYIVLGVLYESYIHPVTILSTLPSAGVGALLALILTGGEFDVISLIGILLLIGIVKKNAIMMVDFALEAERDQGKPPEEAIYQASLLRFRPILMTTFAALFGALPLALSHGTGGELRRPLGITIVGGLALSQLITLYTTPVIYLWFDRLAHWRKARPA
jgi:multidrug efflux pump